MAIQYPPKPWTHGQTFETPAGTLIYVNGTGWVSQSTAFDISDVHARLDYLTAEMDDKLDRDEAVGSTGGSTKAQLITDVVGVTQIDLSLGTYVKVASTLGAWQPKFINMPSGGVEIVLSVDSSGSHPMTDPADTDWDDDTTPPDPADFVLDSRNVFRFTRIPGDEGLIGEFIRDTVVPEGDPVITIPTLEGYYSVSADRSNPVALDGATLPYGPVYIWFGPSFSGSSNFHIFFNHTGALPADGQEAVADTYVWTSPSFPHNLLNGVAWDQDAGDPTGNALDSYLLPGENTITIVAYATDGGTSEKTFTFNTTATPVAGSDPEMTTTSGIYTAGATSHSVTIPSGVDRTVLVQCIYRNTADASITGLTLGGTQMTVGATEWYFNTQFFGQIVCTLNEADLSTGTFDIIPQWASPGPAASSIIAYRVWVLTNVASPTWRHDLDYYNSTTDRQPSLTSVAENSFLFTSSGEASGSSTLTLTGITPTTLYTNEYADTPWVDMSWRSAVDTDSGVLATQTARWSNTAKGLACLSALDYEGSIGDPGDPGVTPGTVGVVTLDNSVDNQLAASWDPVTGIAVQPTYNTYDVIVDTDLGGDPDDIQSLIRLCHFSDILKVQKIVSTKPVKTITEIRTDMIKDWIKRADLDYLRSLGYTNLMTEADMLATVVEGNQNVDDTPAPGKDTAGSNAIIDTANNVGKAYDRDTNPLWILVWGTSGTVAQALHDDPSIVDKIRLYTISSFNAVRWTQATGYNNTLEEYEWLMSFRDTRSDIWWINNGDPGPNAVNYGDEWTFDGAFEGGVGGEWDPITFFNTNIRGHGSRHDGLFTQKTGDALPASVYYPVGGLKEGDSPSMFYLLSDELGSMSSDVDDPTGESWGGQFQKPNAGSYPNYYSDLPTNPATTVSKWRTEFLGTWRDRWDWYDQAVGYQIRWGTTNPPARTPVAVGGTSTILTGLLASSTQYVQVRVVSADGTLSAAWSNVVSSIVNGDPEVPGDGWQTINKFMTSTDPYDVSMSEGSGEMHYNDLWLPTAWRRVNARGDTEGYLGGIVAATTVNDDKMVGRWQSARKTPFQQEAGPRLFVTLHMSVGFHGVFNKSNVDEMAACVLDLGKSGSTQETYNRDGVWKRIAGDTMKTVNINGSNWDLWKHLHLSISHESSGGWSGQYWGYVPALIGHPALKNPSSTVYGTKMREAILHVYNTGLLTKVHARAYEHISDVFDAYDNGRGQAIIRGMSPANSNSSEPVGDGSTGAPLTTGFWDEAMPEYGVDFMYPTNYWRKGGLTLLPGGDPNTPSDYTDAGSWGAAAMAYADAYAAPYGQLEYGCEYATIDFNKVPGDASAPTDLELANAFKHTYDTVFPSHAHGLGMMQHWVFLTSATGSTPSYGNSFHLLEGVWGRIKPGEAFTGTDIPNAEQMLNPGLTPQSNTRYPLTLDWYRDEFQKSKLY